MAKAAGFRLDSSPSRRKVTPENRRPIGPVRQSLVERDNPVESGSYPLKVIVLRSMMTRCVRAAPGDYVGPNGGFRVRCSPLLHFLNDLAGRELVPPLPLDDSHGRVDNVLSTPDHVPESGPVGDKPFSQTADGRRPTVMYDGGRTMERRGGRGQGDRRRAEERGLRRVPRARVQSPDASRGGRRQGRGMAGLGPRLVIDPLRR